MEVSAVLAFAAVAVTLIVVPGPDWAFVLAAGVRDRVLVPAVAGLVIGYGLLTAVVAAGIGPLAAAAPASLGVLTMVGGAYLIYLGASILRSSGNHPPPSATVASVVTGGRVLRRGIGVSALNPKGLLFFVAFLPQFARPSDSWPLSVQLIVLGGVWAVLVAAFYTALGYTADRVLTARPALARLITRAAGVAMIVLGLVLLGEQFAHIIA